MAYSIFKFKFKMFFLTFVIIQVYLLIYTSSMSKWRNFSIWTLLHQEDNKTVLPKDLPRTFYVDRNKVVGDNLQLKGYYNDTFVSIDEKILNLKGLPDMFNHQMSFLLTHKKLESVEFRSAKMFAESRTIMDVDCSALVRGDESEINKTIKLMKVNAKTEVTAKQYIQFASNCSTFCTDRQYITNSLTDVEQNFPIAFSMLMYQSVEQAERLLRAIYRPQNLYCIHVDKKSPDELFDVMSAIADCFDNVFTIKNRVSVTWGKFSVLEPELLCMEELWNRSSSWKYFINLTGQEFPLRTNYELVQILRAYNGANDVDGTIKRATKNRWTKAGPPPHGIIPTKGEAHVVVSRGFVNYVLHDKRAADFLNWTKYVHIPDEVFFTSLNHNPHLGVPGSYKGEPERDDTDRKPYLARFKNWGERPCRGKYVRKICIFGIGDLRTLTDRRQLFANKFHIDFQQYTLNCLEELIYNHTRDEYLGRRFFNSQWYSTLGFVRDKVNAVE